MKISKHKATIYMPQKYVWDFPNTVVEALSGCLILECVYDKRFEMYRYFVTNDNLFPEIPEGILPPIYDPIFEEELELVGENGAFRLNMKFEGYEKRETH